MCRKLVFVAAAVLLLGVWVLLGSAPALAQPARGASSGLVLQRRVQQHSILSRPAGRIEGCGPARLHSSIRGSVSLPLHSTATQDAGWNVQGELCVVIVAATPPDDIHQE